MGGGGMVAGGVAQVMSKKASSTPGQACTGWQHAKPANTLALPAPSQLSHRPRSASHSEHRTSYMPQARWAWTGSAAPDAANAHAV